MSTTHDTAFAPGCFGTALCHDDKDEICQRCPFASQCGPLSAQALTELQGYMGVDTGPRRRSSEEMSKKAQAIFESLGQTAKEIKSGLMAGRNPFLKPSSFLSDVARSLLHMNGNMSRAMLVDVLMSRQQIKRSSADTCVRQAIQILSHCGAIKVNGDEISLLKE